MTITIPPEFEPALTERARREGQSPEQYALGLLRLVLSPPPRELSVEEKLAILRTAGVETGVALSDEAVSSEGLYD